MLDTSNGQVNLYKNLYQEMQHHKYNQKLNSLRYH